MKTKKMRALFAMFIALISLNVNAGKFKIVKISPNQTIKIGDKQCGLNAVFDDDDIIYWDKDVECQAIRVICIEKECSNMYTIAMDISKNQFRKETGQSVSWNQLISLVSKGSKIEEPNVIWKDELFTIKGIEPNDNYIYYCRLKGNMKKIPLLIQKGKLCVEGANFTQYTGKYQLEIYKKSKNDNLDNNIVRIIDVEIL